MAKPSSSQRLDQTFAALGDATRRALLRRLAGGNRTVSELAEPFDMSLPAVSKHLRVLERAGLVARTVEGRVHTLRLEAKPMKEANRWLAFYQQFWGTNLDSLGTFLQTMPSDAAAESPVEKTSNQKRNRKKPSRKKPKRGS